MILYFFKMLRFATFGYDSVFLMVSSGSANGAQRPKVSTLFSSLDLEDHLNGSVTMDAMDRLLKQEVETVRSEHTYLIHSLNNIVCSIVGIKNILIFRCEETNRRYRLDSWFRQSTIRRTGRKCVRKWAAWIEWNRVHTIGWCRTQ